MRRCAWMAAAILALCTTVQAAITITPSEPTDQDEIQVTVSHWTNTGGYSINNITTRVMGSLIQIDLFWTTPRPGSAVTQAFVQHQRTASLGRLSPGLYKVRVLHYGLSVPSESASFTVTAGSQAPNPQPNPHCDCFCHAWGHLFRSGACPLCGCSGLDIPDYSTPNPFDLFRNRLPLLPW